MSDATETAGVEPAAPALFTSPEPEGRAKDADAPMRIGPFTVGRRVSAAPGAHLYEATDTEGAKRILQVVRLRAPADDVDKSARHDEERRVALRTAELLGRPGVSLHAHGGADGADGSRLLFWALPPEEGAVPVADRPRRDVSSLLELARALAAQLAERHGQGRVEPLLSEHTAVFDAAASPRILGVPVDVKDEWLAEGFVGARRAPEEAGGEPLKSGDVWRLGQLLRTVSAALSLPEPVARVLEGLVREDPSRRPASGAEILGDLDGLLASEPELMALDELDPGLFPAEEVTQSASVHEVPPADATDPLAVTTWGATEWTEVEANRTPISPEDLPPVVDPDAPTRAETAVDPSAPPVGPTDPAAQAAAPVVHDPQSLHVPQAPSWQTDPAATPTQRPEPVTDEARHEGVLEPENATTAEAAPEPPSSPDLEVIDPEDVHEVPAETKADTPSEATDDEAPEGSGDAPAAEPDETPAEPRAEGEGDEAEPAPAEPADSTEATLDETGTPSEAEGSTASAEEAPEAAAAPAEPEASEADAPEDAAAPAHEPEPVQAEVEPAEAEAEAPSEIEASTEAAPIPELVEDEDDDEDEALATVATADTDLPSTEAEPAPDAAADKPGLDGATTLNEDDEVPTAVAMRSTEAAADPDGAAPTKRVDPIAAAWDQPVLPAGESPWSEVVSPRGAHRRDHSEFPGFEEDLPSEPPSEPAVPVSAPPAPSVPIASVPYEDEATPEELAAAVSAFDPRKAVAAVLAVLVIFGLFALIARSGDDRAAIRPTDVAPPANEFVLEVEPAGALVVAQVDGRILGKAPLTFLVPPGAKASVFIVADGYEPIALELLERGAVEAKLEPSPTETCDVQLRSATPVDIESIGGAAARLGEVRVAGAKLVRATPGQALVGARLVRCPDRGGLPTQQLDFQPAPIAASVRITEPAGAAAYLDGEPVGRVPTVARGEHAFVEVRVDDASGMNVSRWVPVRGPLEVRMPAPKPRRRPLLVVPDSRPGDADGVEAMAALAPKAKQMSASMKRRIKRLKRAGARHLKAGRTRRASRSFRECLRLSPDEAVCHRGLGHLYRRIGQPKKAIEYYARYLELRPEAADAERIRGYLVE